MATQIKLRRDTYQNWYDNNPVLGLAEPGFDTTNKKLKIGDGTTAWRSLNYFDDQQTDLTTVAQDIIPDADNTRNIGSPDRRWQHGYFASGSLYVGDLKLSNNAGTLLVQQVTDAGLETEAPVPDTPGVVTTDRLVNGANTFAITAAGVLELNGSTFTGGGGSTDRITANGIDIYVNGNGTLVLPATDTELVNTAIISSTANIQVNTNGNFWTFSRSDGSLTLPGTLRFPGNDYGVFQIIPAQNTYVSASTPTIVFTGTQYVETMKATIQVIDNSATAVGGISTYNTQLCEILVVKQRVYNANIDATSFTVEAMVYGVVHTSLTPMATFDAQWNAVTNQIEITMVKDAAYTALTAKVMATESVNLAP